MDPSSATLSLLLKILPVLTSQDLYRKFCHIFIFQLKQPLCISNRRSLFLFSCHWKTPDKTNLDDCINFMANENKRRTSIDLCSLFKVIAFDGTSSLFKKLQTGKATPPIKYYWVVPTCCKYPLIKTKSAFSSGISSNLTREQPVPGPEEKFRQLKVKFLKKLMTKFPDNSMQCQILLQFLCIYD